MWSHVKARGMSGWTQQMRMNEVMIRCTIFEPFSALKTCFGVRVCSDGFFKLYNTGHVPSDLACGQKVSSMRNLQTVSRASLILGVGSRHDVFCHDVFCHVVTGQATSHSIFRTICQTQAHHVVPFRVSGIPCHGKLHHFIMFCHSLAKNSFEVISCEMLSMPLCDVLPLFIAIKATVHSDRHVRNSSSSMHC